MDFWDPEPGYYLNGTYYGEKNIEYLVGVKAILPYRILFIIAASAIIAWLLTMEQVPLHLAALILDANGGAFASALPADQTVLARVVLPAAPLARMSGEVGVGGDLAPELTGLLREGQQLGIEVEVHARNLLVGPHPDPIVARARVASLSSRSIRPGGERRLISLSATVIHDDVVIGAHGIARGRADRA
mgnify:CR=1 FL=1